MASGAVRAPRLLRSRRPPIGPTEFEIQISVGSPPTFVYAESPGPYGALGSEVGEKGEEGVGRDLG